MDYDILIRGGTLIAPGMAADLVLFDANSVGSAGQVLRS